MAGAWLYPPSASSTSELRAQRGQEEQRERRPADCGEHGIHRIDDLGRRAAPAKTVRVAHCSLSFHWGSISPNGAGAAATESGARGAHVLRIVRGSPCASAAGDRLVVRKSLIRQWHAVCLTSSRGAPDRHKECVR